MTTDPRQEAEDAVDTLVEAYRQADPVAASKQHVRLVGALAAAIELHEVLDGISLIQGADGSVAVPLLPEWLLANERLHEALSALRNRRRAIPKPDNRAAECVERWPECETGAYDPRCCRFPKSCSADVHREG